MVKKHKFETWNLYDLFCIFKLVITLKMLCVNAFMSEKNVFIGRCQNIFQQRQLKINEIGNF